MERQAAWKHYPYVVTPDDPEMTFPAAEGDQGAESNTYYVAGRLRGKASAREWAFLVIFTFNNVRKRMRTDFYTFALFDLVNGDLRDLFRDRPAASVPHPPPAQAVGGARPSRRRLPRRRRHQHVDDAARRRRIAQPFSYAVSLLGRDPDGRRMHLALIARHAEAADAGGRRAVPAASRRAWASTARTPTSRATCASAARSSGATCGEEVEGDSGWIDRQWTPRHLGTHNDWRNRRYRHEWRQIHLDNGMEMSVWFHVDRLRGNRQIPFSGATAATPDGRVFATSEFTIERHSYVRDPDLVRARSRMSRGAQYLADRYRLVIPAWELDLLSEPLVAAPAHDLPIEYWSGPTRIQGTVGGRPVRGLGFNERTWVFARDFELVDVLRDTLRHLPEGAFPVGSPGPLKLSAQAWEVDAFLSHGGRAAAREHLRTRLRPHVEDLAEPHRGHVRRIVDDLDAALQRGA